MKHLVPLCYGHWIALLQTLPIIKELLRDIGSLAIIIETFDSSKLIDEATFFVVDMAEAFREGFLFAF